MLATKALDGMIVNQPKTHNGRPVLVGTGTTVRSIAIMVKQGYSLEEITAELPIDLAQVYAALTYYHLHTDMTVDTLRKVGIIDLGGTSRHA